MIAISVSPVATRTFSDTRIPLYAVHATSEIPHVVHAQTGTSMPYSACTAGVSTVLARYEKTSAGANGSHSVMYQPAKNPARGCSERAIHVYQPPAEGKALASWFTATANGRRIAPAKRYARGAASPARPTVNTNVDTIANAGAIVAIPCMRTPS